MPRIELVAGEKLVLLFQKLELVERKAYELDERFFEEHRN